VGALSLLHSVAKNYLKFINHQKGNCMEYFQRNSGIVISTVLLFASYSLGSIASFQGLGDLSGGDYHSEAWGVSPDGSMVVGYGTGSDNWEAVRWNPDIGMDSLGVVIDGNAYDKTIANAASTGGEVIVGNGYIGLSARAFRWTDNNGMVGLGTLPGGYANSQARAVSENGTVIIGSAQNSARKYEAFRWTAEQGMIGLGDLPGGTFQSTAYDVSDDGTVIVGKSNGLGVEAFRWTSETGIVSLHDLPGGHLESSASGITGDGSVIVGYGSSDNGREAFRWTAETGMVPLGDLAGGRYWSQASSVSDDGGTIVGWAATDLGYEAFIWTESSGMTNLRDLLQNEFFLNVDGWILTGATEISSDGTVVVGYGINPDGNNEAWIARLPEPTTTLSLDIKPGSCPNPLNTNTQGKGRLPMAILGTDTFDVNEIEVDSISIAGTVLPVRTPVIEDVGTPLDGQECECHEPEGDGHDDLLIHFSKREIILALGLDEMETGAVVPITVEGELLDGTPFEATDCVTLVPRSD
jgi:probable HAF family extracellular repeat protein